MKPLSALSLIALLVTLTSAQNTYPDLAIIFAQGDTHTRVLLSDIATTQPSELPLNPTLRVFVYFIGFYSDVFSGYYLQSVFETLGECNYIIIDWSAYNHGIFLETQKNFSPIAKEYAATLVGLVGRGLITVNNLHFIGFSFGAQLAGNTAREAKLLSPTFNVPRITGLDPSNPKLVPPDVIGDRSFQGLKKTDATFVDVIHTDVMFSGTSESVGTVDFFPNNGAFPQPGCPAYIHEYNPYPKSNVCSHARALNLFAESITNVNAFAAKKCTGTTTISQSSVACSQLEATSSGKMGFHAALTLTGNYFLDTYGEPPFNRNERYATEFLHDEF